MLQERILYHWLLEDGNIHRSVSVVERIYHELLLWPCSQYHVTLEALIFRLGIHFLYETLEHQGVSQEKIHSPWRLLTLSLKAALEHQQFLSQYHVPEQLHYDDPWNYLLQ